MVLKYALSLSTIPTFIRYNVDAIKTINVIFTVVFPLFRTMSSKYTPKLIRTMGKLSKQSIIK